MPQALVVQLAKLCQLCRQFGALPRCLLHPSRVAVHPASRLLQLGLGCLLSSGVRSVLLAGNLCGRRRVGAPALQPVRSHLTHDH